MEERKDNRYMGAFILGAIVGFALWVILICLKAAGVVGMHWALVLSGLVWLPWSVFAFTALVAAIVWQIRKLKRWYRRRKVDARIIRQAKAAGVWDKTPIVLGGRALEIKAWKNFKIKRKPGETDKELRDRCMKLYEVAAKEATKMIAAVCEVPVNILTGEWKQENDQNQEGERINE